LTADAESKRRAYLDRMTTRVWRLFREYWLDAFIVFLAVFGAFEIVTSEGEPDAPTIPIAAGVAAELAFTLVLLLRRRFPFAAPASMLIGGAAVSFVDGRIFPFTFAGFLTALTACFLLGMLEERRQALIGLGVAFAALAIIIINDPNPVGGDAVIIPIVFLMVWLFGAGLGRKLEQAREAEERAARIERQRAEEAREAVAEERARIARELHDVVGHAVSVMTVQASGVRRLLKPDQQREREALEIVEQTGREALAEMRRLVGVLRRPEEAPALAPQPSLQHLDRLVRQAADAGLPVEVQIEGRQGDLPAGVDLTAYRLVQEALTNAVKHANAKRADVLVRYGDDVVELIVTDDGDGVPDEKAESGGHGLVGMRERVAVYGGELRAGPRPEGGYALHARLPRT
jgi:signal transduction histidine kinase